MDERIIINKTIYSKILNTNDDGKLEGEIDISNCLFPNITSCFTMGIVAIGNQERRGITFLMMSLM